MEPFTSTASVGAGFFKAQKGIQQVLQSVKMIHEALHGMHQKKLLRAFEMQHVLSASG
jgi:hypothetical protein